MVFRKLNIAKDDYSAINCQNINKTLLLNYYIEEEHKANELVLENEFVGITYDNLGIIKKYIDENDDIKKQAVLMK